MQDVLIKQRFGIDPKRLTLWEYLILLEFIKSQEPTS